MSKKCLHCGYEAPDHAKFCIRCGTRFSDSEKDSERDMKLESDMEKETQKETQTETQTPDVAVNGESGEAQTETNEKTEKLEVGEKPEPTEKAEDTEEVEKISAEWQGKNVMCDFGGSPATGQYSPEWKRVMDSRTPEYYETQRREQTEAAKKTNALGRRKMLFALAFVGLLLDFLCGVGFFMCLPVAIIASVDSRRLYAAEKKTSTQLIWTMVIGYIGAVLGLIFLILMF